jgi:diguanylate cyclase (GGDEF)-like protein
LTSPSPAAPKFDTTPRGLVRLYFRIVFTTGSAILVLHTALKFGLGFGGPTGTMLLALDGILLVVAFLGLEIERQSEGRRSQEPKGFFFLALGLLLVLLCFETGGLASPYFMLVLTTCIFASITMRPRGALLLVALIGLAYAFCAWLAPTEGFLKGGLASVGTMISAGRRMPVEEITALAIHCAFLFVGSYIALRLSMGFRESVSRLEESATRDPLTSLPNRRGFMEKMGQEIGRAERYAWPISILLIDLDHFKRVNDEHGHGFGDTVLSTASKILRDTVGTIDHLARVGGEEFAVAAVAADPNHGAELAGRILRRFRTYDWASLKPNLKLTCSIGVAVLHPGRHSVDAGASLSTLLDEADHSLYHVKQNGRDNFHVAAPRERRILPAPPTVRS